MEGFERYIFNYHRGGRSPAPVATLTTGGLIRINPQTFRKYDFAGCSHYVLYFNAATRQIGIELNDNPESEGCRGIKFDTVRGGQISARSFVKHYGIDISQKKRYEVSFVEASGMLIIDLKREVK